MLIEKRAYREKIKFFERNKEAILALDAPLETEIWFYYTQATFEIGDYRKFIKLSEPLLQKVIAENVYFYGDVNVYQSLLFNKAACHLNIKEYKKAEYLFGELIKIDPNNKLYPKAFLQNRLLEKIKDSMTVKYIAVVMLFVIIAMCLLEMLVLNPFYPEAGVRLGMLRDVLAISLFGTLLIYAAYHYLSAKQSVRQKLLDKKTYL